MAKTDYGNVEEGVSMTQEVTRKNKKAANVPGSGLYRHPESGQEAIVLADPLWGNTQAQGFVRLGFKFIREVEPSEIVTLPELAADTRKQEEGTLKGLSARLDALENVGAENKALTEEVAELRKKLAEAEAAKKVETKTEKAAAEHVAEAGASQVSDAQEQSAEGAKANAEATQDSRKQASGSTNTKVNEKDGK